MREHISLKCDQIILAVQYQFVSFEDKHDLSLFWNLFILFLKNLELRTPVNLWWFDIPLQNNPMQEQCANLLCEKILIWKLKVLYRLNAIQILFYLKDAMLYKMRMAQWSYPRPWFLFGELKIHNRLCVCSLLLLFFWPS